MQRADRVRSAECRMRGHANNSTNPCQALHTHTTAHSSARPNPLCAGIRADWRPARRVRRGRRRGRGARNVRTPDRADGRQRTVREARGRGGGEENRREYESQVRLRSFLRGSAPCSDHISGVLLSSRRDKFSVGRTIVAFHVGEDMWHDAEIRAVLPDDRFTVFFTDFALETELGLRYRLSAP